jgi:hypothetical protein
MQPDDNDTPEQEDSFDLARFDEPPASIVFGDADDPLFELSVYVASDTDRRCRVELDSEQRTAISGLLAQTPAVIQSGYVALNATYRLSFASGVASKMADIMKAQGGGLRAVALDQQGKILGNGVLNPVNGMRALAAATAVWQAMTIITAQVHLSEISARLAKIERGIDEIRALLEAEQSSQVESGLRYVREAAAALRRRNLTESERMRYADKLEDVWRECGQVSRTLLAMLNRGSTDFATLKLKPWYQLPDVVALVRDTIAAFERRAHAYLLAEYVRCATIALRVLLDLNPDVSEHRLDELHGDLVDWQASIKGFFSAVSERVRGDLSATFRKQATIDDEQRKLLDQANEAAQRLIAFCLEVEQLRVRTQSQVQQAGAAQPMTLIVTLDERGQIAETYDIPDSPQEPMLKSTRGKA